MRSLLFSPETINALVSVVSQGYLLFKSTLEKRVLRRFAVLHHFRQTIVSLHNGMPQSLYGTCHQQLVGRRTQQSPSNNLSVQHSFLIQRGETSQLIFKLPTDNARTFAVAEFSNYLGDSTLLALISNGQTGTVSITKPPLLNMAVLKQLPSTHCRGILASEIVHVSSRSR